MKLTFLSFNSEPLVLRYMSSYLKENGHEVEIIYLKEEFNRNNISSLLNFLKKSKPDLVGLEVYTGWLKKAEFLTKIIQKKNNLQVIWGGAHVNTCPEESINIADIICVGEGEEALLDLLNSLEKNKPINKIKNLWIRDKKSGEVIKNPVRNLVENLDKYPFPDYNPSDSYVLIKKRLKRLTKKDIEDIISAKYSILGGRGCIFSCTYCCNHQNRKRYFGKGIYFRKRSIKNVIAELVWAKKNFKHINYIRIWDDLFMMRDINELKEFCELYKEKINLPFSCRLQFTLVTDEILNLLKNAGVQDIELGIESGSERVRKEIFKRFTPPKKILEVAGKLHKKNIETVYNIIFNNPYETVEDLKECINLLIDFPRPLNLQGFNLIFLPGTEIYERAIKDRFIFPQDFKSKIPKAPLFRFSYDNQLDNFLYKINFESKQKKYFNILISLTPSFPKKFLRYAVDNKNLFTMSIVYSYVSIVKPIKLGIKVIFEWIRKHETIKAPLSRLLIKFPSLRKIAQFRKWESMN